MKQLGVFLLPVDAMLVTPSIKFAATHLYTWVERATVGVKCLAKEHNGRRSGVRVRGLTPERAIWVQTLAGDIVLCS